MTVCVKEGEISFVPLGNFTSFIGHQTVEEYSSLEGAAKSNILRLIKPEWIIDNLDMFRKGKTTTKSNIQIHN